MSEVNPIIIYKESLNFQVSIGREILEDLRILSEKILLKIKWDI